MFGPQVNNDIRAHAEAEYPKESCGYVERLQYHPLENKSTEPEKAYIFEWPLGAIVEAIIHSHPEGPDYPSERDMRCQLDSAVPHGITLVTKTESGPAAFDPFWFGDGAPKAPLVGRGFRHGVTDCYSLIRDWYSIEKEIDLPEFPRSWGWWETGQDLYEDGFIKAGFSPIVDPSRPNVGDVFIMHIKSETLNHAGVYLGNGLILHHTSAQGSDLSSLSKREPIGGRIKYVRHWIRHKDLC